MSNGPPMALRVHEPLTVTRCRTCRCLEGRLNAVLN
jgi:hypothetical protein